MSKSLKPQALHSGFLHVGSIDFYEAGWKSFCEQSRTMHPAMFAGLAPHPDEGRVRSAVLEAQVSTLSCGAPIAEFRRHGRPLLGRRQNDKRSSPAKDELRPRGALLATQSTRELLKTRLCPGFSPPNLCVRSPRLTEARWARVLKVPVSKVMTRRLSSERRAVNFLAAVVRMELVAASSTSLHT